jgi:hypothetical protein
MKRIVERISDLGFGIWSIISRMRIIVFSTVAVVQLAVAALGLFVLLVGLNGYSERHATPGLIAYVVLCLATVPGMGALGAMVARVLVEKKRFGKAGASVGAIVGVVILGIVVLVTGVVAAFVIAEVLRRIS